MAEKEVRKKKDDSVGVSAEVKEVQDGEKGKKVVASATMTYTGPIPTPDMMRKYDAVNPGFSERIMRLAEEDSKRDTMMVETESRRVDRSLDIESRSQWMLFVLLLILVAAAVYFFYVGNVKAGLAFLAFPVLKEARALFSKPSGNEEKKK